MIKLLWYSSFFLPTSEENVLQEESLNVLPLREVNYGSLERWSQNELNPSYSTRAAWPWASHSIFTYVNREKNSTYLEFSCEDEMNECTEQCLAQINFPWSIYYNCSSKEGSWMTSHPACFESQSWKLGDHAFIQYVPSKYFNKPVLT